MKGEPLSFWVVYDHPRDMPDRVVARRHECHIGGCSWPTADVVVGDTVSAVRERLPRGLVCLPRHPRDEPHIVETWL